MLYRKISSLIEEHLKSDTNKILLIDGARQVGKTYIVRHVGKKLFENFIEVNMIEDMLSDRLFAEVRTVEDFYLQISMLAGDKMHFSALPYTPHETENAMHSYELPEIHYTVIRAALQQMGVGGDNSWGAMTHEEFLLDVGEKMEFSFYMKGI